MWGRVGGESEGVERVRGSVGERVRGEIVGRESEGESGGERVGVVWGRVGGESEGGERVRGSVGER